MSLTRVLNSWAALLVNVKPKISSGSIFASSINHKTLSAITLVFPVPAPAITKAGSSGAFIAFICSGVKFNFVSDFTQQPPCLLVGQDTFE